MTGGSSRWRDGRRFVCAIQTCELKILGADKAGELADFLEIVHFAGSIAVSTVPMAAES